MEEKFYPENVLQRISSKYNLNTVDKESVLENLKFINAKLENCLRDYLLIYDSYRFIKTDKNLMFISRDLWQSELTNFKNNLEEKFRELEKGCI